MIVRKIKRYLFDKKWRRINKNNYTTANHIFDPSLVEVGDYSYGGISIVSYSKVSKLIIGRFCSIGQGVVFILNGEHNTNTFSTYPFKVRILKQDSEAFSKGDIVLHDDVWIGFGAIILSGVTIGQGAIIAAGSVVTKNCEPYGIYAGNPAKLVKKRFDESIINRMVNVDLSQLSPKIISDNINLLYTKISGENVDKIITTLNNMKGSDVDGS